MSESEAVPIHPVAPRLKAGSKIPHIGPDLAAYKAAHAETLGHESDKWWRKVNSCNHLFACLNHRCDGLDGPPNVALGSPIPNRAFRWI